MSDIISAFGDPMRVLSALLHFRRHRSLRHHLIAIKPTSDRLQELGIILQRLGADTHLRTYLYYLGVLENCHDGLLLLISARWLHWVGLLASLCAWWHDLGIGDLRNLVDHC